MAGAGLAVGGLATLRMWEMVVASDAAVDSGKPGLPR